jgi:hypothetical protein
VIIKVKCRKLKAGSTLCSTDIRVFGGEMVGFAFAGTKASSGLNCFYRPQFTGVVCQKVRRK